MIGKFCGDILLCGPLDLKCSLLVYLVARLRNKKKDLTNLIFSVRTSTYGSSSFFPFIYSLRAKGKGGINTGLLAVRTSNTLSKRYLFPRLLKKCIYGGQSPYPHLSSINFVFLASDIFNAFGIFIFS